MNNNLPYEHTTVTPTSLSMYYTISYKRIDYMIAFNSIVNGYIEVASGFNG